MYVGVLYFILRYFTDKYSIYYVYRPSPFHGRQFLHRSAINFVIVGAVFLQISTLFFSIVRLGKLPCSLCTSLAILPYFSTTLNPDVLILQPRDCGAEKFPFCCFSLSHCGSIMYLQFFSTTIHVASTLIIFMNHTLLLLCSKCICLNWRHGIQHMYASYLITVKGETERKHIIM